MADDHATPEGVEDAFPATPAQSGMLFHTLAAPGTGVYLGQFVASAPPDLDPARLRAAWDAVIARHGSLRSLLLWEGFDAPVQVVREALAPEWIELDWSGAQDEEAALEAHLAALRAEGIDLASGPTNRFSLIRRPNGGRRFVWTCHHALCDGWSAQIALREVAEACAGRPPARAAAPYRDFVDWMAGRDEAADASFWRGALAGYREPARLNLPRADRPGPAGGDAAELDPADLARLKEVAADLGATLSDVVATAWGVVLHRATDRDDVVFGMATTLRPSELPGVEGIVGNFVSTLPARLRLDAHETLAELISARARDALAARPHEAIAPAEIERLSELPPGEPLIETILAMEAEPDDAALAPLAELRDIHFSSYPMALLVYPGRRFRIAVLHDGATFGPEASRILLSMTAAALRALPDALDGSPFDLPVMSRRERAAALTGDAAPAPAEAPFVEDAFAARAAETPDAPAVITADATLSYAELERASRLWARRLAGLGLGPGDHVGILLERGAPAIVAVLAALRAGCAYVPLDPAHPEPRRARMLEVARPRAVLTTAALAAGVEGALAMDAPDPALAEADPRPASPEDAAYVIFTSGSTGAPKGVTVRRRNLAVSNAARRTVYGGPPTRFLLLSPLSFDSSVAGLFWTLAGGGALILPSPGEETDPAALGALIARTGAAETLCLPSVLDVLMERPTAEIASLKTLIAAGEPLTQATVERAARALPGARLFNEYGPTEATVWCLAHRATPEGRGPAPVGRPVPGASAMLRDRRDRPVPQGLAGELVVGGDGVAAGYLGDPALTAARFPPDPADPSRRLYRTGDLMRRRPDGAYAFLGRADGQVKIRGHRVEPAEAEAAVAAMPGVREAAVLAVGEGDRLRLAAYVRAEPDAPPRIEDLRAEAERVLPAWLRPAAWRLVETLPRLPNGKIDRAALPAPSDEAADAGRPPATALERDLARIWRETLWLDRDIGAEEDFFELGGHSILSMRLVNAVERELGRRVPVRALARLTTVAALAAALEAEAGPAPRAEAPAAAHDPDDPLAALSDAELREMHAYSASWPGEPLREGSLIRVLNGDGALPPVFFWFNMAEEFTGAARHLGPDQPVWGMRTGATVVDAPGDEAQLRNHRRVALHYLREVLAAQPEGPYHFAGMCQGATIAVNVGLLLHGLRKPVATIVMIEKAPPQAYPGHVDIVFGRDSFLNPFKIFPRAELAWNARYRDWSLDTVEGEYGVMFNDRFGPETCGVIARRLAEARRRPPFPLPPAAYAAEWSAPSLPARLPPRGRARAEATLRNAGPAPWGGTVDGGLRVAARWLDASGAPLIAPEAACDIAGPWPPGEARRVTLPLQAPEVEGRHTLEIDVVEEGLIRFADAGAAPLTVGIEVAADAPEPEIAPEIAPEEPPEDGSAADPRHDAPAARADTLARGRRAHALGDHATAVACLTEARADALGLLTDLGESRRRLGRIAEAERDLGLALRLDPRDSRALATLGRIRIEQNRPLAAAILLRRSLAAREDLAVRGELERLDVHRNPIRRGVNRLRKLYRRLRRATARPPGDDRFGEPR